MHINKTDGTTRDVNWGELNQLKKDILWVFDQNGNELHSSFIPVESFSLPYWEYLALAGGTQLSEKDKTFYQEGALIIISSMLAEYLDIACGNQSVFGQNDLYEILNYVDLFSPTNENQSALKELLILGFSIAVTITPEAIANNEECKHPELADFYSKLSLITKMFVQPYYRSKLI